MVAMDADDFDLSEWPDAREAYRSAHELGRRAKDPGGQSSSETIRARDDARRELARMRARLRLLGLDPAATARELAAIDLGEVDGLAGVGPRW